MTHGFYDATVPVYRRGLNGLLTLLARANESSGPDANPLDYLGSTAAEPLRPISGQIVISCHKAGNDMRRVLGRPVLNWPSVELTFAGVNQRIHETCDFLAGLGVDEVVQAQQATVTLGSAAKGNLRTMPATDFILARSLPQFFFHLTAVYVTLRQAGVKIGKPDFLGHL